MMPTLFFYLFSIFTILAGIMVVVARNPVHSVLFLILSFFTSAGLFILLGAELLAMLLVVVYVGAVAVLFLFVVMMLDINFAELREGLKRHLPLGLMVGVVLLAELVVVFGESGAKVSSVSGGAISPARSNTALIGDVLYTEYILLFQIAGLILLVAMIGAITLTSRQREGVKRQSVIAQNARTRADTVAVVSVETGEPPVAITGNKTEQRTLS